MNKRFWGYVIDVAIAIGGIAIVAGVIYDAARK